MKTSRVVAVLGGALAVLVGTAGSAFAQTHIAPTTVPERVDGGWIYWLAFLSLALALVLVIFLIAAYMRYAPRFAKDEDEARVVHADRVQPGREAPSPVGGRHPGGADDRPAAAGHCCGRSSDSCTSSGCTGRRRAGSGSCPGSGARCRTGSRRTCSRRARSGLPGTACSCGRSS